MIESASISQKEMKLRTLASVATFVVAVLVICLKFWAYNLTHSQAIYSDALEGIVNLLTALAGIAIIYYASKPADENHPYGHGKAEYFSAAFEGGLITFAAIVVFVEAIKAYLADAPIHELSSGMYIASVAGIINIAYGRFLKVIGKKYASPTLEAAGIHLIMDFWTTFGAVAALLLVKWTGLIILDRVVALLLGLHMAATGLNLVRKSLAGLMDAEDVKILKRLAEVFEKHAGEGIIQIHHAKVIRSGWFHHIDAHIVVPEFWTIEKAHGRVEVFEKAIIKDYEYGGEANFHLDPCRRKYCEVCDYPDCPVRAHAFKARLSVVLAHLRSRDEPLDFSKKNQ